MPEEDSTKESDFPWEMGIFDAHCHPTDIMSSIPYIADMKIEAIAIMSTRAEDQLLVSHCARILSASSNNVTLNCSKVKVIPSFGWHPWFAHMLCDGDKNTDSESHTKAAKIDHYRSVLVPPVEDEIFIASLADPTPLSDFISQTRERLKSHPLAMIGEVGLDRSFRIPSAWTSEQINSRDSALTTGGREGRPLTRYRVDMKHQQKILLAQLRLAAEMQRPASVHGVNAHGLLFTTIKKTWEGFETSKKCSKEEKLNVIDGNIHHNSSRDLGGSKGCVPYPPRICLHSYSGDPQMIRQYLHPSVPITIFFSFSTAVNFSGSSSKAEAAIRAVPDEFILVESDLHKAGKTMEKQLELVVRKVCEIKRWSLADGIKILRQNWNRFIYGENNKCVERRGSNAEHS